MRIRISLLILITASFSFTQTLKFLKTKHDFGKIVKGTIDTMRFRFVNTGNAPLQLNDSYVECDCTTPILPKGTFAPGDSGTVTVIYDSKDSYGLQDREVIIYSNSLSGNESVRFFGEVIEPTAHADKISKGKLNLQFNRTFVYQSNSAQHAIDVPSLLKAKHGTDTIMRGYVTDASGNKFLIFSWSEYRNENIQAYFKNCDSSLKLNSLAFKYINGKERRERMAFIAPLGVSAVALAGAYWISRKNPNGLLQYIPVAAGIPVALLCYRSLKKNNKKRFNKGIDYLVKSVDYYNSSCAN